MYKMARDALLVGLIAILFLIGTSLASFISILHPHRITSSQTPASFGVKYQRINFLTHDDIRLHGWYVPAEEKTNKTIILLHGYGADMGDILPSRLFLHKKYNLFFFDFRYFGESEGKHSTVGMQEVHDLEAAVKLMKNKYHAKSIGVWGLSMGGAVALMGATHDADIKAVVAESSYADLDTMANHYYAIPLLRYPVGRLLRLWGYVFFGYDDASDSPLKAAEQLRIPVLYLHSKADSIVPFEHLVQIQKASKSNPKSSFYIYDKLRHGGLPADYQEKISSFFAESL